MILLTTLVFFRKPWEHALTFARAHQVEPAMVPAGLVLVAAAASNPLLVTRVILPSRHRA
jgi:hypothetical protein